jgi:flagellar basal-body rod protein FlgB
MSQFQTPMLATLEQYLNVAAFRHVLIAGNIANIDTPGYRTRDVSFAAEMRRALDAGDSGFDPVVREVPSLIERPDGNNVNLERESLLLSQVQLQFQAGVQLLRAEFRRIQTAINEGRSL